MLPTALTLENYRAFAQPTHLELRPLTLLFGINNSGKSALLRALPLLEASVSPDATGALDLETPAVRGATFRDLQWKGLQEDEDQDLGVGFRWGKQLVQYRLTWFDPWRRLMVRRMRLSDGTGSRVLEVEWIPRPEDKGKAEHTYKVQLHAEHGDASRQKLGFRGLVPVSFPEGLERDLKSLGCRLRSLDDQVQWLQAVRRAPQRLTNAPSAPRRKLRPDGSDAPGALFSDPQLLTDVSAWYEEHLGRRLHDQELPPGGFRLMLQNLQRSELDIDLIDAGEGLIQVLPVLTALSLSRREDGPKILAIEEPESHLHPALQRHLAAYLGELIQTDSSPRIVLETHSEHLLLGIQLEVVRGCLQPEDVQIYWVHQADSGESFAEPVALDAQARLQENWPPGVYSDDLEVAREIIRKRREHAQP